MPPLRTDDLPADDYRELVERSPAMIWRTGTGAERGYFNATWLAYTGRPLDREVGHGWLESVHRDDAPALRAAYFGYVEARQSFEVEYRLRRADGVYRLVVERGAPYVDERGEFKGFIGSCIDVGDRRGDDIASDFSNFFDMSIDNLSLAGFDGYIKRASRSWTTTLGWSADELTARPSLDFVHPDDREATLARRQELMDGKVMSPLKNRYLSKDGTYRWFEWRSVADPEKRLVYAAARDITDQMLAQERLARATELQEKLQRQLIFADRMATVGTLAAGVAHEINNPLAFVAANIAMIVEGLEAMGKKGSSEESTELADMAVDAQAGAERIRKIVRGLKTFSRAADDERVSVIDVRTVLELAINMTFNEIRHRARLVKDYGKIPPILADDARLAQVFINLLVNAAQALPEGESATNEIRITTSTAPTGHAVIDIRDSGGGIPADVIGRIFDPFFTTKPVGIGTGLGLSICHSIVTAMGGEISVASDVGRGTNFRVVLPASVEDAREAPKAAASPAVAVACAAVLVVDDEPAIGVVLRRVLREHEVTVVTTGREALELIESGRHFDVVVSDLMMPEMSGMDLYAEIVRRFPPLAERFVFVTGGAFAPAAAAFLERTTNARIEKPFNPQVVREIVQRLAK